MMADFSKSILFINNFNVVLAKFNAEKNAPLRWQTVHVLVKIKLSEGETPPDNFFQFKSV